ncbi:MAG: Asp23/Gls24 family envelope stress response protein [Clostridiales bacterium]|nr:Asp23/Gls24 family envelope stress response protein [Clostridiales bacterium]
MSENMTIDMEKDQDKGQITYANEVISTIVSVATTEVEGISGIVGATSMSGIIGKGRTPRGVRVDMDGDDVNVDVSVTVDYGMPIQKVGRNAQENVRKSIESMTGLHVEKVDLHVVGVNFEKENQEMQLSQNAVLTTDDEDEEHVEAAPVEIVETEPEANEDDEDQE